MALRPPAAAGTVRVAVCLMLALALAVAGAVAGPRRAHAATVTWSGAVDGSWANAGNWDAPPALGDDLIFPAGPTTVSTTDDLGFAVNSVTFQASGYSVAGSLALQGQAKITVETGTATVASVSGTSLDKLGSGILALSGVSTYTGGTTLTDGTLRLAAQGPLPTTTTLTILPPANLNLNGHTQTIVSLMGDGFVHGTGTLTLTAGGSYAGNIDGPGGAVTIAGGTLDLSGANSYTGATTILAGASLHPTVPAAVSSASDFTVGGTLDLVAVASATARTLAGSGSVHLPTGVLTVSSGGTYGGTMDGSGGLDAGGGTLVLSGASSYTGGTQIDSGATLRPAVPGALPAASAVAVSGTLDLSGLAATTINSLDGGGAIILPTGSLTTGDANPHSLSGLISGSGGLTKAGAGQLTLGAHETYTGTTNVLAGKLLVLDTISGAVVVRSGAALNGVGGSPGAAVGPLTVQAGGNLKPGQSGPGLITGPSANLAGSLSVALDGAAAGTGYDQVSVSGLATLGGSLDATLGAYNPGLGQAHVIVTGGSLMGTFAGLPNTAYLVVGGKMFQITYAAGQAILTRVEAVTSTVLSSSAPTSVYGQSINLTAMVSTSAPGQPTGTVDFKEGASSLGSAGLSGGSAVLPLSNLGIGAHALTAAYGGDGALTYGPSTSPVMTQTVTKATTTTTVTSSENPASPSLPAVLRATVTVNAPGAGLAAGTVKFKDGGTDMGTVTLAGGSGTISTASLSLGTHQITAVYNGSAFFTGSTSAVFNQGIANATGGKYHPVSPFRLLDTRDNNPGQGTMGANSTLDLKVVGTGTAPNNIPATGVAAVVLNVTVTNPAAFSYLTVYPGGASQRPLASNLNFGPGQTIANLAEVTVGNNGNVTFYNSQGTVDVIADVNGYVSSDTSASVAGLYKALNSPVRILDTRSGLGGTSRPIGPDSSIDLQVAGVAGITGAGAVVLNVTAINDSTSSYLTVYPAGAGQRPLASNVNFPAGRNLPNRVIVQLGSGGKVSIYNSQGAVDVVVDAAAYFTDGSDPSAVGALYHALTTPIRILDTRPDSLVGPYPVPFPAKQSRVVDVAAAQGDGVPGTAVAAVLNVTVTNATAGSFLTVYPNGTQLPQASDLNFGPSDTIPNLVLVRLGGGQIQIFNDSGGTDVLVDVSGYYA